MAQEVRRDKDERDNNIKKCEIVWCIKISWTKILEEKAKERVV